MDIEGTLYRIINGSYYTFVKSKRYKVVLPNLQIKQQAHALSLDIIQNNRFDTTHWLTKHQAEKILRTNDIWNNEQEEQLKILNNRLEDMKIELYLKYIDPAMKKKIKASLETGKSAIAELLGKKHSMDHLTLDSHAESAKNSYILTHTIYDDKDNLVFNDEHVDSGELEDFMTAVQKHDVSHDDLRTLARSEIWKSYWDAAKGNIFAPPAYLWTDEQRLLINISKMYDSVREHPECPEDAVINDDDALDGWVLFWKRKAEKERKKNKLMEDVGGKYKNAGEVFVIANSTEEAKEIYGLNDAKGMAEIRHMQKLAADNTSESGIPWQDLPHVKTQIQNQVNSKQQSMAAQKGN
jgi:hypothetical protein|tara:strand:- start:2800 stop:3858 length:1059 start_codon:yes stop_codon:yes gene_type:complete